MFWSHDIALKAGEHNDHSESAMIFLDDDAVSATSLSPEDLSATAFTSLRRGILLIEPNRALLAAEALLLTHSDYSVTPAFSHDGIFALRHTKAIALAIVSDCLGPRSLTAMTETVRRQWPLARILILGRAESVLEDHLYDEQIEHSIDPNQLLKDLERLYKGSWNPRSNILDWNAGCRVAYVARTVPHESDLIKCSGPGRN